MLCLHETRIVILKDSFNFIIYIDWSNIKALCLLVLLPVFITMIICFRTQKHTTITLFCCYFVDDDSILFLSVPLQESREYLKKYINWTKYSTWKPSQTAVTGYQNCLPTAWFKNTFKNPSENLNLPWQRTHNVTQ